MQKVTSVTWKIKMRLPQSTENVSVSGMAAIRHLANKLIQHHLKEHTGDIKDEVFQVLLNDQAKALNVPGRQMRWHPLVIKWCPRLYPKSYSCYEDMRTSGFLKLPSGRTLSDLQEFLLSKVRLEDKPSLANEDTFSAAKTW